MGIAVLGPLTIEGDQRVLGRRDRVVLAALAVHPGEVVSADALADVLWDEQVPPPSWPKIVQGCIVRLRKVLGGQAIETTPAGYRLRLARDEIDAQRFERAVTRAGELLTAGDPERAAVVLADALRLWRGRPLIELEGWDPARIEAARLIELRHTAEELYVESALRSGRHGQVLAKAQALVAEAPLRERRWALLATAQYQSGRQGEALQTLRRLRSVLDRELGLDSSPDIDSLEQAILRQDQSLVVDVALPEPSPVCPYRGLRPYDVDDADGFFGRDADVASCLRKLTDTSVVAVVGPSGCGKSSLVRAGVAAALRRDGKRVAVMTPGVRPLSALAEAMPGTGPPPALLVDQCEEVFSLCQDTAEQEAFLTALSAHPESAPLILSFRADRMAELSSHPAFAKTVEQGLHLLVGMAESDLRTTIEQPARQASLVVEPGLVDLLVGEVADHPGALPLMSHALAETWKRREGRTLTVAGYNESGGIRGAVAQSAETIYERIPACKHQVLRDLMLRLVTPGPEGEPVRSRLPRRLVVAGPENDAMIDLLIGARLVTSDDGVVELAHESLARAWPRLRGWLDDDLEGQRILHHLAIAADSWDGLGRPDSELYRGVRLATALDWQQRTSPALTGTEQDFLAQGKRLDEAELHAAENQARHQLRVNRRLRTALTTAAVLLVGALVAGLVAVRQAERADRQATAAADAAVAADAGRAGAKAVVQNDVDTAMLLAVAGVRLEDTSESRANLLAVLSKHPQLVRSVEVEQRDVTGLAVSPDGALVALSDRSGAVVLYDQRTGKPAAEHWPNGRQNGAIHPDSGSGAISFDPRGRQLAVGMPSPTTRPVQFLDPRTLQPVAESRQLPRLPAPALARHIGHNRDGTSFFALVKLYADGPSSDATAESVLVWDVRPGARPSVRMNVRLVGDLEAGAAISPDGDRLYTSTPLTAYEVATGTVVFSQPKLSYFGVDVSPDGKRLALGGDIPTGETDLDPGDVLLLDASTGKEQRRLRGHGEEIVTARFSHDGTRLVSTSADVTAKVWDAETGRVIEEIRHGEDLLQVVGFSRDDATLYTANVGALRSWDLDGRHRYLVQTTKPSPGGIYGCIWPAPGGRTIFRQGKAGIWFIDVSTGKSTRPVWSGAGEWWTADTNCLNWHPRGDRAVTVKAGVIREWNTQTGQVVVKRNVRGARVVDIDFSGRDGSRIVIGQESGLATMLDADTLEPVGKPVQIGDSINALSAGPDNRTAAVLTGGKQVAGGLRTSATRWALLDLEAGTVIRTGKVTMRTPQGMAFSPDGRHVAIGSEQGQVLVLDIVTGTAAGSAAPTHRGTGGLAYTADGTLLVASGQDGAVSLYAGDTGAPLGAIVVPNRTVINSEFEADGRTVLITSYDDAVFRWDTRIEHAVEHACRNAGRELTPGEWRENFGGRPYRKVCS